MRREVMAIVNDRQERSGWALRLERAILFGLRQRSYALVACALLGIVSVSVLAQMRRTSFDTKRAVAVFEGRDTLIRPEGYRDWIFVGSSEEPRRAGIDHDPEGATRTPTQGVYIDPSGYREYAKTGTFPEGTLMVWESVRQESQTADGPHRPSSVLLASVKDSARFEGGWGFFDFSGIEGRVKSKAQVLPESSGCRACHREDAATDHVFTQFYPILRSARRLERREGPSRLFKPSLAAHI
jgi:hypothetical protein